MSGRDRASEAVWVRLERDTAVRYPGRVLEEAALTKARELARTFSGDRGNLSAVHLLG
jgi:hypothetical protein